MAKSTPLGALEKIQPKKGRLEKERAFLKEGMHASGERGNEFQQSPILVSGVRWFVATRAFRVLGVVWRVSRWLGWFF